MIANGFARLALILVLILAAAGCARRESDYWRGVSKGTGEILRGER